jgi:hypothetical protein
MVATACSWPWEVRCRVERGSLERLVAEVLLDLAEVDAGLEEVGGVAVAQGVDGDPLREAELAHHPAQRSLHAVLGHGVCGGDGGFLIAADGGEEPVRVAMRAPVVPEHLEGAGRERDVAVAGAFATVDVDHLARAVDVADLEEETFGET